MNIEIKKLMPEHEAELTMIVVNSSVGAWVRNYVPNFFGTSVPEESKIPVCVISITASNRGILGKTCRGTYRRDCKGTGGKGR